MPLYSPGRRRAILLLLLSSALIITLDLRGNWALDQARSAWTEALRPFESAAEVVARPIRNAWRGITRYDDLAAENRELRAQIEAGRSNVVQARTVLDLYYALLASEGLASASDYDLVQAPVVGPAPTNLDQLIEIDRGADDGIEVGMPVLSTGGGFYIGKVSKVFAHSALVRLITDTSFYLEVKIVRPAGEVPEVQFNVVTTTTSTTTTTTTVSPDGSAPPEAEAATTLPPEPVTATSAPADADGGGEVAAVDPNATPAGDTTTTTTLPPSAPRETGQLNGQGAGQLLRITGIRNNPSAGAPQPDDIVVTSGGSGSLAPADIPIGLVREVINTSPAEGLTLLVVPFSNLDSFDLVSVMLYKPEREAPSGD